jgi:hypothetical protein
MKYLYNNTAGRKRKDATCSDRTSTTRSLSPLHAYAVRALMRRARIGLSHALLIAELAGICREANHD